MIDALIVHGSFGSPFGNWFPWLASSLGEKGRRVIVPHFPSEKLQNLATWMRILDSYSDPFSNNLEVYAHSLAPAFVVDYCVERQKRIKKAVFVAPFYGLIGIDEYDEVNQTFFVDKSYLEKFRLCCNEVFCVFSDNDPYVPKAMSEDFARLTGAKTRLVSGGEHLNASAGFREFPLLLSL